MLQKMITLLYLSGEPVKVEYLAKLIGVEKEEIESGLGELRTALQTIGLDLLVNVEGLSIVTQPAQAQLVEQFWKGELEGDLTPATLQVLTLVAYLGSPTREQISYVRGVQSSQSIRTLTVRGLIVRQGENCLLTAEALKNLGITRVEELPDYETVHARLSEKLETRND